MSSSYVRNQIKTFFATEFPGEPLIDYTAEERELQQILTQYAVGQTDDWYAIQFIGADEEPIAITSNNSQGCYRETGQLFFHIVTYAGIRLASLPADRLLVNAEAVRDAYRGKNINGIYIESVTPINTESGNTLEFEHGWISGSIIMSYYRDLNL